MRTSAVVAGAIASAIAIGTVAYVRADSFSCEQAAKDSCAGVKDCCKPPPCMYRYQFVMYRMLQSLFADPTIRKCGGGDVQNYVVGLAASGKLDPYLPVCPDTYEGKSLKFPPTLLTQRTKKNTDSPCAIYLKDKYGETLTTPERASAMSQSCTELLKVNFDHEGVHMAGCAKAGQSHFPQDSQSVVADEEVKAYQTSISDIDDLLHNWMARCTTLPRKKARDEAKKGIDALKAMIKSAKAAKGCP